MPLRKGAWYSVGVLKDMDKFAFLIGGRIYTGKNVYRGKNQEQYIAKNREKQTYNHMHSGGVVPRVS